MPHVNIKHFPKAPNDFTEEQRHQLAEAITEVVMEYFGVHDGAVSIALEPVAEADWNETVGIPELTDRRHLLIKAPDYGN